MSKGYLTTHVLDTYNGVPGSGIKGSLYIFEGNNKKKIKSFTLNENGKCDNPILENEKFNIGKYEIEFHCGEYFKKFTNLDEIPFLDDVVVRFGISDKSEHYHVPLLISPWSYTTYRGS
ncbi:hydroxyisourate hydrolase [Alphaproteobacteria bacterium]|nr:hydroxyisourate hydrolase [Alphaproteobacteria bacterium]